MIHLILFFELQKHNLMKMLSPFNPPSLHPSVYQSKMSLKQKRVKKRKREKERKRERKREEREREKEGERGRKRERGRIIVTNGIEKMELNYRKKKNAPI